MIQAPTSRCPHYDRARAASGQVAAVPPRSGITSRRLIIRGSRSSQGCANLGHRSRIEAPRAGYFRSGSAGLGCQCSRAMIRGRGDGDESFNQAAAVCFRAHHQRRGVRHHDRDPAPRIEVILGYSAVLVLAVFGMGEVVVLAQIQLLHRPAALAP
jgi:hypothetical protein